MKQPSPPERTVTVLKKISLLILPLFLAAATPSLAADMTAPVKKLMALAEENWKADNPASNDYFSEDLLNSIYSEDFAEAYRAASKFPAYDPPEGETTGSPFDHDVIANGQDGCPFENVRVEDDGDGQVTALFNNRACMGDDPANKDDSVVIFHVKEEGGRPVIDDIYLVENGSSGTGIKEQMLEIAKQ